MDIQTNYRFLVCASYLIFYRCEDEIIFVLRILYGRRDYTRILFGDLLKEEEK
jgi:toxin ParE1/3/4